MPLNDRLLSGVFRSGALISRVKDENEAIKLANDSPYGLGGSVITKDIERGKRVARQIETGMVFIITERRRPTIRWSREFRLWPRTLGTWDW